MITTLLANEFLTKLNKNKMYFSCPCRLYKHIGMYVLLGKSAILSSTAPSFDWQRLDVNSQRLRACNFEVNKVQDAPTYT